jgi:hypothetical protein
MPPLRPPNAPNGEPSRLAFGVEGEDNKNETQHFLDRTISGPDLGRPPGNGGHSLGHLDTSPQPRTINPRGETSMGFKVQQKMCATCIYRPDSPLDLKKLEDDVRDRHMGFNGFRICHASNDACCRGFWDAHKDEFATGQIAQRLNAVEFVNVDVLHNE